ncbi:MAG TPA: nucleotidyltransferase domain-containing protein [Chthoniobacterales bacterium]|nr:nucleotidyltransferase domain-containing protein [Chthoniobacterales bacterium]
MTLLQQMAAQDFARRETQRAGARDELGCALAELLPGTEVMVFGSLVKPGRFTDESDVDVALQREPATMSIYQLSSLLAERLGRAVDVVLLDECRFRERIMREAEVWTLPG